MQLILSTVNRQMGMFQCLSYKSMFVNLTMLSTNIYYVNLLYKRLYFKGFAGSRWETYFYMKYIKSSPFVFYNHSINWILHAKMLHRHTEKTD